MMIAVECPYYGEAEFLIHHLGLRIQERLDGYPCFRDEERKILLVVTGGGRMSAAMGTSALLAFEKPDQLVLFGTCAGLHEQPAGSLYLINKITDIGSGRSFYPDNERSAGLHEESVLAGDAPLGLSAGRRDIPIPFDLETYLRKNDLKEYGLYDMESSAFWLAAARHLGPHQIHVIRMVSDHGKDYDREKVKELLQTASRRVVPYIRHLMNREETAVFEKDEELAKAFCCSMTMKHQLDQLLRYAKAAGIDWEREIQAMKDRLPCKTREEGKRALYEFAARIAG